MKEFWLDRTECTGCSACANICPLNAISMENDAAGFAYPRIGEKCIDCNACERVCKNREKTAINNDSIPDTYAAWAKDKELRFTSTSGGAFTSLAKAIIEQNGIVYGARYNKELLVEHAKAENMEQLEQLKQSKYVQSDIGLIFREIKAYLDTARLVVFAGTPCQVSGLLSYLEKSYDNLFTIDFICRGVNSPKAYKSWLTEIENKAGQKAVKIWFKYKVNGWKKSPRCTRVDFEDGNHQVFDQDENLYMKGYLGSNLYIRPSCGNCGFKGMPRSSDITLADFWKVDERMDDDRGTSMVLVNCEKGRKWFEVVKTGMEVHKRNFDEVFEGNGYFTDSVVVPKESFAFLNSLDKVVFSRNLKKYETILHIRNIPYRIKKKLIKMRKKMSQDNLK